MELTLDLQEKILELNKNAMSYLKTGNYSNSLSLLKECLVILKSLSPCDLKPKLEGITLNNLGCFYKRVQNPKLALKYLQKACICEEFTNIDNVTKASTCLNICAIYSDLGNHQQALEQSLKALSLLKNSEKSSILITTLVIGYHNTGVEYEFLSNLKESYDYYKLAWQTANKYLGENHPLTKSTQNNCTQMQKKTQEKEITNILKTIEKQDKSPKTPKSPNFKKKLFANTVNKSYNKKIFITSVTPMAKQDLELKNQRYLTGERIQSMHKNKFKIGSGSISPNRDKITSPLISEKKSRKITKISSLPNDSSVKEKNTSNSNISPTKIQQLARGNFVRKKLKDSQHDASKDISIKTKEILKELEILKTQAKLENIIDFEGFIEKPLSKLCFSLPKITKVQAAIRGYLLRLRYQENKEAAIVIQKHIRRYQCMKLYKNIKAAVVFIQSVIRGYQQRKKIINNFSQ